MNRDSRHSHQRGFTIAEVLTATAIFAIIFVAALMIYDRSNRVFKQGVEASEVQQNTRIAFDKMVSDIRMAGFDYDRDGLPTTANQYQQPDEQIEYAAPSALTIRANLNYNGNAQQGRETALENGAFPVVTTGNDEIVTYALASNDSTKNTDTITFYADVTNGTTAARHAFPGVGGSAEDTVTINNVDLCTGGCANPPYTLYRITVKPDGTPNRIALANNIRSMVFNYYSDTTGSTALAIADAGGGKYDPANPGVAATVTARAARAQIRSIGVQLIGMNENKDAAYTAPGETVASAKNFRQFRLESLVVPRNIGKRGMPEQQPAPPGPPTLNRVCSGYCGLVYAEWTAPANDPSFGSVEQYAVKYDTDNVGTFSFEQQFGRALNAMVAVPDVTATWYFTVSALNSYGSATATQVIAVQPINRTQPGSPSALVGSGGPSPAPAAQANVVGLTWTMPTTNVSPYNQLSCTDAAGATSTISAPTQMAQEIAGWRVYRDTNQNFNPAVSGTKIVDETAAGAAAPTVSGTSVAYNDTTVANCYDYFYRVQMVEKCNTVATNSSGCTGVSAWYPAVASPGIKGSAFSSTAPANPAGLTASGTCPGGNCTITLTWPKVTQDASGANVNIVEYPIERQQKLGAIIKSPFSPVATATPANATFSGGTVSYNDGTVPQKDPISGLPYTYEYRIKSQQCGTVSVGYSNIATFPSCTFAGTITASAAGASSGSGAYADPFEVDSPTTLTITASAAVNSITATAYEASSGVPFGGLSGGGGPGPYTSQTFAFAGGVDNTIYRIDYIVTDTAGCQTTGSFYVQEGSFSCCLVPLSLDSSVMTFNSAANTVTILLKNSCGNALTIKGMDIEWDATRSGSSPGKISIASITYPKNPTGTTTGTQSTSTVSGYTTNSVPGASTSQVIASDTSGSYKIVVSFNLIGSFKNITANPIGKVCITYVRSIDTTDQHCKIAPAPSATPNVCD
jgi:prepilin-type N-terminal cleavage/methylation domain-containing protein